MNPLDEKANTLSRCGSFYYRTLIDESKADAEFVSHAHSYTRLMPLGNKITTAIKGGCYYEDYYKIIKFTDRDVDWNGVKQALQYRVRGGMGNITSELEYVSSSKARELGTSAWVLLKEDVPTGLIDVASVQMQTLSTAPVEEPVFLQVYIIDPEGAAIHLATSTQSVTLAAGEFAEWSFAEAFIGTDIYNQNSQIAFQFTTNANSTWQDDDYVPTHLAVGAGAYVPAVQFYKLAAAPALPAFNRPAQLTIEDHFFMGDDKWNWLSKEGTPQPIAFPGGEKDIILPESQELIWDLHINEHIMVTSIKMDDGTMLYANQDFASQFGKLTFLKNPIALFPKMQFMAQSYTGRMPNLYNYLVRADEVYGSIGKMMNYMRGSQSIKSLYHASAQAAGLAVIEKDCTVVAVSPLLEGKLYITTAGRYEANYPHTPLKPGTKLPKDYIIGGNQLYRLIGPYDPMPSNITGINLGSALPVPGLVAPNEDITLYSSYGLYAPAYKGDNAALSAYHTYLNDMSDLRLTKFSGKNAVQVIKPLVAQNKDFQISMWFSIPSAGQTYTLEFDSGRLELVWEERSRAKLTGVFLNATNDEVTSLSLTPSTATAPAASKFLNSTDQAILQQLSDVKKRRVVGTSYKISSKVSAEVEALSNFSALLPAYPGDNYILRLKYNGKTKELLFVLYYSVQWMFSEYPVTGQAWHALNAVGYVGECITITIKNWNIQSLQRVYTTDSTDATLSNYFSALIGEDRSFTAADSLETTNGINHFRYTACPNRCVVACINESYMTSQMKLRLMTYLQRELPIGSVLVTANLPNTVNEFQSPIDGTEFVLEELRAGLNKLVGAGNYEVDSYDGKLVVHTDRLSDEKLQTVRDLIERVVPMNLVVEQYNHHIEISWRDINKYAACKSVADMKAVNADYKNDLTEDGEWIYPLSTMRYGNYLFLGKTNLKRFNITMPNLEEGQSLFKVSGLEYLDITLPKCKLVNQWLDGCSRLKKVRAVLPVCTKAVSICYGVPVEEVYLDVPNVKTMSYGFSGSKIQKIKTSHDSLPIVGNDDGFTNGLFTEWPWKLPCLERGKYLFSNCKLNKDSALRILNSIPSYADGSTRFLTIGIHVDHKTDEEVIAAIANAEAKGWTLTVQWNGTPTSGISTLDLEEIYAKVTESEYGEYTDENGTRCSLDWGHYVSDTTGYKLFFSIYEAEQYFKLTKVEEQVQ